MTIWTDEMKSAAMKDAAAVVRLTKRNAALEASMRAALRHAEANGMKEWPVFVAMRKALG